MKSRSMVALAVLIASPSAFGQEVAVSTTGPAPAPAPVVGHGDGFAAPNGQYGAGLSISRPKGARAYAELGFYSISDNLFGIVDVHYTSLSLLVGGGYKIAPDIELEAMLPFAFAHLSAESTDPDVAVEDDSESGWAVGNLHLGASYVRALEPKLRIKVGGALEWGPWTIDPDDNFAAALTLPPPAYAAHDVGLWQWETLSIVTPSRVEYGDQFVVTGDGSLGLHVPTDGRDADFSIQLDPGFGYYVTPTILAGARLPFIWVPTQGGDNAQVAIEPFGRFDFGAAFANVRFTMNLDDPYGFAFDEGKVWGLHVGGGGTF